MAGAPPSAPAAPTKAGRGKTQLARRAPMKLLARWSTARGDDDEAERRKRPNAL